MTRRIAVFARPPVPGRVKTRLAPGLTAPLACELYRACLEDTLAAARGAPAADRWIYWAEPPEDEPLPDAAGFGVRFQRGADLGERMAVAFEELLDVPDARALIVGADCPELDPSRLERALEALGDADVVLGPTPDGGYYLAALRRPQPRLFAGIEWGTDRVLARTLGIAGAAGLRVTLLDPLQDLDAPEDLVPFMVRGLSSEATGRLHAFQALRAMGLLPEARA